MGASVLLALADDDAADELDDGKVVAHGLDGGGVGGELVTFTEPARGGDGGGFGHANHLEREVAIGSGQRRGESRILVSAEVALGRGEMARASS